MENKNMGAASGFGQWCYKVCKRLIDIIIGIIGCIIFLVVLIFVKFAFLASGDVDTVMFTQERIGLHGKKIKIFKFRSMIKDADRVLEEYLAENEKARKEYEQYKKLKKDPRITPVGKFIRAYSVDEIPQFINVLIGNMSLIGPRPYLWREKDDMGDAYDTIITCKPGITGYWQVNGRSNTDFKERLKMEVYYCENRSLLMDFKIFFKTFYQVIKKDGAE